MPFAVFRQHQRKLLAVFAILAMIGFVLSDTLPRWINSGAVSDKDLVVADLYGKKIHLSDLAIMERKRQRANRFMAYADRFGNMNFFGGARRADLIDALILEHEADRLGIPGTAAFARDWIDQQTNGAMTTAIFESILARFDKQVGGEQLLIDIASQVRLQLARAEVATPVVTPLDVFRNYRDQSERTSFKVVPFLAQSYVDQVKAPTDSEVSEFFAKYKNDLPDPTSPTPGFRIPRQVKAEYLGIDVNAVARRIKAKLPEEELKTYYEGRKKDFPLDGELPVGLFAGAPELTPPRYVPLSEIKDSLSESLAREKANEEVRETFDKIREETIDKFADAYHTVEDDIVDAKKDGASTEGLVLPQPDDLAGVAKKYGLTHEVTPLLDRREAEQHGRISLAKAGSGLSSDGRDKDFADVLFDSKTLLFEGFELNDVLGDRYLVRKIADVPAHEAKLEDIRDQVVRAWKLEKARDYAKKAAEEAAAKIKAAGGEIKALTVGDRPVIAIESVTKMKAGMPTPVMVGGQYQFRKGAAKPTEIRQIGDAGPELLDALFALKPGEVDVKPDLPQSTYYVLTLDKRDPVTYQSLLGPNGSLLGYWTETQSEMMRKAYKEGMARLREQAGYHPEDYPSEEKSQEDDSSE